MSLVMNNLTVNTNEGECTSYNDYRLDEAANHGLAVLQQFSDAGIVDVVAADTEFISQPDGSQKPVCAVFYSLITQQVWKIWFEDGGPYQPPPFDLDRVLLIAFRSDAEQGTFTMLGWDKPAKVIDLYVEWLHINNETERRAELRKKKLTGLLAVCRAKGILTITEAEKEGWRERILAGYPFSPEERAGILDYCLSDVLETAMLFGALMPAIIDIPAAAYRGRYMRAVEVMQRVKIPVDMDLLARLNRHWAEVKKHLVQAVDSGGIYSFDKKGVAHFSFARFGDWLKLNGIEGWPTTRTKRLSDKEAVWDLMKEMYEAVRPLAALKKTLGQTRMGIALEVDDRGFAYANMWPFASTSGRNQPSSKTFAFALAAWMRHLIKPPEGYALVYLDWSAQEFHIAAHLSGDPAMKAVLDTADPYLAFAEMAGSIPKGTLERLGSKQAKRDYAEIRRQFKIVALGVLFGKTAHGIAKELKISEQQAEDLLQQHHEVFHVFWEWVDNCLADARSKGYVETVMGWRRLVPNDGLTFSERAEQRRSLQNFPTQANGGEMIRLAAILATEAGLLLCATVHDACVILAPIAELESATAKMRECMNEASAVILNGHIIPIGVKTVVYPDRYTLDVEDKKSAVEMWHAVLRILEEIEAVPEVLPCEQIVLTFEPAAASTP
jgi:DNA polymerase-1